MHIEWGVGFQLYEKNKTLSIRNWKSLDVILKKKIQETKEKKKKK